jgi:CheY-like chemotaxis protein
MATILIVDDEEAVAQVVSHYLRKAGHTPVVAPTGHAALLAAREHPDVILLDLGLPDMGGDEVLRRFKRHPDTAQIPVVVVSGQPDAADIVARDWATGAVAILQKPVSGSELCGVVDIVHNARSAGADVARGPAPWQRGALSCRQPELLYRLISAGSDLLVRRVCRRLGADRGWEPWCRTAEPSSWPDIVTRARLEGLLAEAEGQILLQEASVRPLGQTA